LGSLSPCGQATSLILAPERPEIHRAFAMGFALGGDNAKAYAFLRSGHQLEQESDD
jgi:hypothetical protein